MQKKEATVGSACGVGLDGADPASVSIFSLGYGLTCVVHI